MKLTASSELRVMRRPIAGYRALRQERRWGWREAWGGGAAWLLVVACFVSWTTARHLRPSHLLLSPLAWWWAPALQMVWIALAARVAAPDEAAAEVIALYHRGHGPWWLWLWGVAAFSVLVPEPRATLAWSLPLGALLAAVAAAWSLALTYGLFRGALARPRDACLRALAVFYGGVTASIVAYYAVAGQLAPIVGWID